MGGVRGLASAGERVSQKRAKFEADQQKLPEAQREAWESASQEVKTSYMRKANQAATGPKGGSKVVTIL